MTKVVSGGKRMVWIDWMKAIGIYLVVLGHFFSVGEKFLYVFHVPLFFLISGFLCKRETETVLFWKKIWYNLVIPMLIMTILNFMISCIMHLLNGSFSPKDFYWFLRNVLFGMVSGFDSLWFVYTLFLLKIIYQYCSSNRLFYFFVAISLSLAYFYNTCDLSSCPFFMKEPNAIVNVCTAYPFFAFGVYIHNYKSALNEWTHRFLLIFTVILGFALTYFSSYYNGCVGLYYCNYGGNMLWFLIGGLSGSIMIYAISKLCECTPKIISVVSQGTIIILGFHKLLITLIKNYYPESVCDVLFAALIVLLFVPFIKAVEKYFPLMVGKYRIL